MSNTRHFVNNTSLIIYLLFLITHVVPSQFRTHLHRREAVRRRWPVERGKMSMLVKRAFTFVPPNNERRWYGDKFWTSDWAHQPRLQSLTLAYIVMLIQWYRPCRVERRKYKSKIGFIWPQINMRTRMHFSSIGFTANDARLKTIYGIIHHRRHQSPLTRVCNKNASIIDCGALVADESVSVALYIFELIFYRIRNP